MLLLLLLLLLFGEEESITLRCATDNQLVSRCLHAALSALLRTFDRLHPPDHPFSLLPPRFHLSYPPFLFLFLSFSFSLSLSLSLFPPPFTLIPPSPPCLHNSPSRRQEAVAPPTFSPVSSLRKRCPPINGQFSSPIGIAAGWQVGGWAPIKATGGRESQLVSIPIAGRKDKPKRAQCNY